MMFDDHVDDDDDDDCSLFTTFNDTYRSGPGTQNETDIAFVVGGKVDRPS